VDNTRLRDHNWKEDFEKWGKLDYYEQNVEIQTYQTVYKWKHDLSEYFIIADEADFAFTEVFGNFFKTYKDANMLAMTGFVTEDKRPFMHAHIPLLLEYTQEQAQQDGILNKTPIVFIKYDLDKDRNQAVKYTSNGMAKTFKQSENSAYNYWDKEVHKWMGKLEEEKQKGVITGDFSGLEAIEKKLMVATGKRTDLLVNSLSSAAITQKLVRHILSKDETSKVVIFSKRREQCDRITRHTYHGGNKEEVNNSNYDKFNRGVIRDLGLVDKINRGVNMVGLNYAIFESFFSADTPLRQRLGRMMRLDPEDFSTIYILLPYFMRKVKNEYVMAPTKAVAWSMSMLKGWDLSESKVWDYRAIKSNI